ncbi:hypothetical protein RYX36_003739 [Vicia faba]
MMELFSSEETIEISSEKATEQFSEMLLECLKSYIVLEFLVVNRNLEIEDDSYVHYSRLFIKKVYSPDSRAAGVHSNSFDVISAVYQAMEHHKFHLKLLLMETGFTMQERFDGVGRLWTTILNKVNTFESIDAFVCYGRVSMLPLLILSTYVAIIIDDYSNTL